jgi:hypothetical protein
MASNISPNVFNWDYKTAAANTEITDFSIPQANRRARLTSLRYTPGATEHDLVIMKAIEQVTLTAASAASDTTLDLSAATFGGDTLASGDWVILEHGDGTYGAYKASGLATLVLTVTAITKAANVGAKVWIMGAPGDTNYHLTFKSGTTTEKHFYDPFGGLAESGYDIGTYFRSGLGDPIMFLSANGTNAGTLNQGAGVYT